MKDEYLAAKLPSRCDLRLFAWGSGSFGQHGHIIDDHIGPVDGFLKNPSVNVHRIFCGACYTFVLKGDGTALGWGSNQNGQIGCSHQRQCLTPTRAEVENVVQLSAGDRHTLFVIEDGSVRGCGSNFYAQLSVDTLEELQRQDKLSPVTLALPDKVKQVACGQYHSLLLYESGELASVGRNVYGQLGVPMPEGVKTDVLETPTTIEGAFKSSVFQIYAGQNHSIATDDAGRCYVWGYCRACGSRGDHVFRPKLLSFPSEGADEPPAISNAAGGSSHSLFLAGARHNSRLMFALGCNLDGQCGLGESINFAARPIPLDISWTGGANVESVSCAENYSCAITTAGELWIWGRNSGVLVAADETSGAEAPRVFAPQRVPVPFAVLSVACGNWHAAAIVDYSDPRDVSHLPGGQSRRQLPAAQVERVAPSGTGQQVDAWVDIVSSREEKPQSCAQLAATEGACTAASLASNPTDPLALVDLDTEVDTGKKPPVPQQVQLKSIEQRPPNSGVESAAGMRRAKSLTTRVPGGEGRQQMLRHRRVQQSPVQADSELVHVYRLASGAGRPGTATYQTQARSGPPQLQRRGDRQQLPPELLCSLQHQVGAPVSVEVAAKQQPLPLPATASVARSPTVAAPRPPAAVAARQQQQQQTSVADASPATVSAIRRRPMSSTLDRASPVAPPSLPVRQNRASLRRMSSSGRLAGGGSSGELA